MDEVFDAAEADVANAERALDEYLVVAGKQAGGREGAVVYVSVHKDSHQLEVPQVLAPGCLCRLQTRHYTLKTGVICKSLRNCKFSVLARTQHTTPLHYQRCQEQLNRSAILAVSWLSR